MGKQTVFYKGLIVLLLWLAVGCAGGVEVPTATAVPTETVTAPAAVVVVRDAVLDFLREGANECVPPVGAVWQTSTGGEQTPAAYALYRFTTGDHCTVTVSYLLESENDPVYHVALGHGASGFCWQALVDGRGHVLKTGVAANSDPDVGNPAAIYCEAQGNVFEVVTQPNGLQCGYCVFSDGSRCNGWAYLHNECQPGDEPVDNGS
jgi:putative hemolysin